ncbi:MAG: hypothetical protein VCC01_12115 [Candidatus Hydrogenedentota bacterium]
MAEKTPVHPAIQGCIHVLERGELLLDRIPEPLYTFREGTHDSIGCHLRHGIEHISCFLEGLDSGVVDYDLRRRDEVLETDVDAMREAINETRASLIGIDPHALGKRLTVIQIPTPGCSPTPVESSVVRELIFLSSHMVHHLSLMYIHCTNAGVELPQDFPLAFSTSAHRKVAVG